MTEITLTKENFDDEALHSELPVLIDFWAEWCGPCKMLAPIVSEIAGEYAGKVKVCKVDVDTQPELAGAFRVSSIPTLVLMDKGEIKNVSVGYRPKEQITAML